MRIAEKKQENLNLFNRWARSYDNPLLQFWMGRFQKPIPEQIDFSRKNRILDISCGTGKLLSKLERQDKENNLELFGLDMAAEMLRKAREKLPSRVKLLFGDVHSLPFKKNYFDVVTSTEAFHHYYDQTKALQEMARVSRDKIIVVDIDFFLPVIHQLFEKLEPGCVKINRPREMQELFEAAGLKNIHQKRSFLFAVMTSGKKTP